MRRFGRLGENGDPPDLVFYLVQHLRHILAFGDVDDDVSDAGGGKAGDLLDALKPFQTFLNRANDRCFNVFGRRARIRHGDGNLVGVDGGEDADIES